MLFVLVRFYVHFDIYSSCLVAHGYLHDNTRAGTMVQTGVGSFTNDADSLHVNAGSPPDARRSPLAPPSLRHELDERPLDPGSDTLDLEDEVVHEKIKTEEQLRFTIDPTGALTHDETAVDVVTVPCPGGNPLGSWTRDGLVGRYFGAPSMRDAGVSTTNAERSGPSWVRQGIRREADRARILLYEHPDLGATTTLGRLADALLQELYALMAREGRQKARPLVFITHSIGGLIVKMALLKASRSSRLESIWSECYGVAFFGSSYFAMPSLAPSIQKLLQLSAPLPTSITDDLRVGNPLLLRVDEDFKTIAHDLRVWTFYETIDSRLSSNGSGDVYFTAPLTSIRSAILGMRQERIFPLQSDHANIASFGRHNVHTLHLFLRQLAFQVSRADESSQDGSCWSLNLKQKVNVEIHGFFEDPIGPDGLLTLRAWSTRLPLRDFLNKGPDKCLSERINEVDGAPEEDRFLRTRGKTSLIPGQGKVADDNNALGISAGTVPTVALPASPIIRPVDARGERRTESAPEIVRAGPLTPPSRPISPLTRYSTPMRRASPLIRADFDQDLAIDRLSPPLRPSIGRSISRSFSLGSEGSRFEFRDFPPFSQRSRSSCGTDQISPGGLDDEGLESPLLPEAVVAIRKVVKNSKRRTSETVIVDEVPRAFAKPEMSSKKFAWIHVPFNNPAWVKDVLESLQVYYKKDLSSLYNQDFWATKHTRGRHSQHYAYFAKPGCYFTAPRTLSPRPHSVLSRSMSSTPIAEAMYTCLFLPYLHFDTYKRLVRRRELILERIHQGRSRPIPEHVAKSDSLELQVIWEYLGHDPPLNCRRTIDQYGYPSLRDTRPRDDDQMLYKLTKERVSMPGHRRGLFSDESSGRAASDRTGGSWKDHLIGNIGNDGGDVPEEEKLLDGNVLVVDQLWLWVINSRKFQFPSFSPADHPDTVVTFFPKRESDPIEGPLYQQADLRDSIFNEVNVDLTRQCDNALDLAALSALHAVSVFLDRSSHPDLEVFRIFEEAISVLNEKLTSSLKAFRLEGIRDKSYDFEPVENKERSIRARHKEEGRRAERENRNNTSALLELRDIEDELLILIHLFERQSKVLQSMLSVYSRPDLRELTANGRLYLGEALKRLSEYGHQANEMIERVRNTRDDYDKLLQMVQRQAQVDEVRLSRFHADLASAQGRSVMIFTTFTVIFLPLSFFTSFFGMNTQEWAGGDNLALRTIGAIALPSSALLIVGALVVAWSTTVRWLFSLLGQLYNIVISWLYVTFWRPVARAVVRRLRQRRRQRPVNEDREGKARLVKEASDFWERHRLERERGYQIPQVNKKNVTRAKSLSKGKKEKEMRVKTV
ncbi:Protein SERAC1 [Paramyrothecium foliicola]|nr:Protein SERAC1 [Paramyrothecium foliicola]